MKDWIPLLQSLVWPLFLGLLVIAYRNSFKSILLAIKKRIDDGSEVNLGPGGFGLGAAPKLPDEPEAEDIIDDGSREDSHPELLAREQEIEEQEKRIPEKSIQLVHRTAFLKVKNNRNYYRIVVSLDCRDPEALAKVECVIYYLHRTFKNPVREVTDSDSNFALRTAAWGEFTIRADVYMQGRKEPIRLSRYISIQG